MQGKDVQFYTTFKVCNKKGVYFRKPANYTLEVCKITHLFQKTPLKACTITTSPRKKCVKIHAFLVYIHTLRYVNQHANSCVHLNIY